MSLLVAATLLTMHLRDFSRAAPATSASVPCGYAAQKVSRAGARRPGVGSVCGGSCGERSASCGQRSVVRDGNGQGTGVGSAVARRAVEVELLPGCSAHVLEVCRRIRPGVARDRRSPRRTSGSSCGRLGQEGAGPALRRHRDGDGACGQRASADQSRRGAADGAQTRHRTRGRAAGRTWRRPRRMRAPPWSRARWARPRAAAYGTAMARLVGRKPCTTVASSPVIRRNRPRSRSWSMTPATEIVGPDAVDGTRRRRHARPPRAGAPPCLAGQRWAGRERSRRAALPRAGRAGRPVEDAVEQAKR